MFPIAGQTAGPNGLKYTFFSNFLFFYTGNAGPFSLHNPSDPSDPFDPSDSSDPSDPSDPNKKYVFLMKVVKQLKKMKKMTFLGILPTIVTLHATEESKSKSYIFLFFNIYCEC